jgi:hypothetical protein
MDTQIIAVYCLCDDLLRALGHKDDRQCQMSTAEVMTIAMVAALHYRGNFATACKMLHEQGYLPRMLSAAASIASDLHPVTKSCLDGVPGLQLCLSHAASRSGSTTFTVTTRCKMLVSVLRIRTAPRSCIHVNSGASTGWRVTCQISVSL